MGVACVAGGISRAIIFLCFSSGASNGSSGEAARRLVSSWVDEGIAADEVHGYAAETNKALAREIQPATQATMVRE